MATVEELLVKIKADTRQLESALEKTKQKTKSSTGAFGKLGIALKAVKGPAKIVAGILSAGFVVAAPAIARVGAEFESLKISLNTVFGSATAGQVAFDNIKKFATESPFQIRDLTKAFIQLKSAGIEPTQQMLNTFADTASVTLNPLESFEALVRITQRSASGGLGLEELNQLSDRGIPVFEILAKKTGLARLEVAEFGKTVEGAAEIMGALNEGFQETFGGATAAKMDTLNQKISNLQDSLSGLAETIFEDTGFGDFLKDFADSTREAVQDVTRAVKKATSGMSDEFFDAESIQERADVLGKEIADLESQRVAALSDENKSLFGTKSEALREREASEIQEKINLLFAERTKLLKEIADENERIEKSKVEEKNAQEAKKTNEELIAQRKLRKDQIKDVAKITEGFETESQKLEEQLAIVQEIAKGTAEEVAQAFGNVAPSAIVEALQAKISEAKAEEALAPLMEEFGDLLSLAESTLSPIDELTNGIKRMEEALGDKEGVFFKFLLGQGFTEEQIDSIITKLNAQLKEMTDKGEEVAETFDSSLRDAVVNASNAFTNDFVNALMNGKSALESFKNFAKNLVSQIISIFLQMAVINEILNTIFPGLNAPTFSNMRTPVNAEAGGGTYQPNRPLLVGERGPELMIPNTGGKILNNMNTKNAFGGGDNIVINQNLNFSTGVVPTVRTEITKMLPEIAEVSKASVLEATRRGGSFRRGLLNA
jgi:tape measure domain-containing protein